MKNISKNELRILLVLLKEFNVRYNANSLSKRISLSSMGTLKLLKKLKKENILISESLGRAVFYSLNFSNPYTHSFLEFALQREAEEADKRIKRWVIELNKFENISEIGILFGSVLRKENFKDVDLMLVLSKSKNKNVERILNELNQINVKKIHIIKQTKDDLEKNIGGKDAVVMDAIKSGIILFGFKQIVKIIENASYKK